MLRHCKISVVPLCGSWTARTVVSGYAVHPEDTPGSGGDFMAAQRKTFTRFNLARRIHQLIVVAVLPSRAEAAFGLADTAAERGVATVNEVDARADPSSDAYCSSNYARLASRAIRLCGGRARERR